jgi:hypothetical protein
METHALIPDWKRFLPKNPNDLPSFYLAWLVRQDFLPEEVRQHLQEILQLRGDWQPRGDSGPPELISALAVLGLTWPCEEEELKEAYRQKAMQCHPDTGGNAEAFKAVQAAYELVTSALAG